MKNIETLAKLVVVLRESGVVLDSPYDFENWIQDHARHSDLFKTGLFKTEDEE
jgi:hypothetical protein